MQQVIKVTGKFQTKSGTTWLKRLSVEKNLLLAKGQV